MKTRESLRKFRTDAARRARIKEIEERGEELSAEQAADFLKIKKSTLASLTSQGELPAYRGFGRPIYFKNELVRYKNFIYQEV